MILRLALTLILLALPTPSLAIKSVPAARERSAPKAVVPFNSYDFGEVYTGDLISQLFVIRNEGNADLQITEFKGECGCTVVRMDKIIPPGKEAIAEIEVQTASQSGLINKIAKMHTNDPDQPIIIFTLIANVLKGSPIRQGKYVGPIFLSPDSKGAMFAMPGKKTSSEFSIVADQTPVKVLRVEEGTKDFSVRLVENEAGRSYRIVVESMPMEKSGLYTDQIRVITDHPTLPALKIELSLRVYETK